MKKPIILFGIILLLGSCISKIEDTFEKASNTTAIVWNPTIAVPLVYSTMGIKDILNEAGDLDFIRVESDGSLTLIYSDNHVSKTAEEAIVLGDQNYTESLALTGAQLSTLNTTGTLSTTYNRTLGYLFGTNEIDKIWFKNGTMTLSVSSTLEHDISLSLSIPESDKGGNSFSEAVNASYTGSLPNSSSKAIDLDGLEIDYTKTGQGHSEMEVTIALVITKKNGNTIKVAETVDYTVALSNQKYSQLTGLFSISNLSSAAGDINVSFFDQNTNGSFTLADPKIKFTFNNNLGIPISVDILQFDGKNTSNNIVNLTGIPSPLPISSPSMAQIGQTITDSLLINNSNSNISAFINNRPSLISYDIDIKTNASGVSRNWFLDTSKLDVKIDVEVPLDGTAKDYSIEKSQPFDIGLESTEEIKEVLVRLYTENGFPVDIATQLYFEDSTSNTVLDSLISTDILILPSASIDGGGKVTTASPKTTDIILDAAAIDRIKNADRIRIKAFFNTPFDSGGGSQPNVKFYEEYEILFQLGVQAEVLIEQKL